MGVSLFLARLIGIYMVVIGISLFKEPKFFKDCGKKLAKDVVSLFIIGIFALIIGALLVLSHNVWVWRWPLIITIIAWGGLLKGSFILIAPKETKKMMAFFIDKINVKWYGLGIALFGLFFLWKGFFR